MAVRSAPPIQLTAHEQGELDRLCRDPRFPRRVQLRAWIILRASQGTRSRAIAREFLVDPGTVSLWRRRFLIHRISGIRTDAPRSGRRPRIPASLVTKIVAASAGSDAGPGGRPSSRTLSKAMRVSQSTVIRIWKTHGVSTMAPPTASPAVRTVRDVRGVYLTSEDRALVFLARSSDPEPAGPPATGQIAGTRRVPGLSEASRKPRSDPLATVRVLYRTSVPEHGSIHQIRDFLLFLQGIDDTLAPGDEAHVVLETQRLGKEAAILRWLRRRPAFHLYTTPKEAFDGPVGFELPEGLTVRGVRASSLRSLPKLVEAFRTYSASHALSPRPFVWSTAQEVAVRPRPEPRRRSGPSSHPAARPPPLALTEPRPLAEPTIALAPRLVTVLGLPAMPIGISGGLARVPPMGALPPVIVPLRSASPAVPALSLFPPVQSPAPAPMGAAAAPWKPSGRATRERL